MRHVVKLGNNAYVSWYLIGSYLFHIHRIKILSDEMVHEACARIIGLSSEITHPHKSLIDMKTLRAGDLLRLNKDQYPMMTRAAASQLVEGAYKERIDIT